MAAFETGFHETIPAGRAALRGAAGMGREARRQALGLPRRQPSLHRRADGASCSASRDAKIISCHLGGSSSLCAIRTGKSVANSLGMSPQSGLPHNNRVGDFDPFALPVLMRATGKTLEQVARRPGQSFGLAGPERRSNDLRDIEAAAGDGRRRGRSWPSTCSSPRCGTTWARICCC